MGERGDRVQEVTINTIRDGVILALSLLFPGTIIYEEKIPQNFEAPCFFVKLLTGDQAHELNRRYYRTHAFDIHFFPKGEEYNREAHDVAERLYEELRELRIDGALYRGTSMSHEVVDDVLHFFVDINFHVLRPKDQVPKMKTLEQEGYLKHG